MNTAFTPTPSDAVSALRSTLSGQARSTATTWVSRDRDGNMVAVKVVDMEDSHIFRWVQYFRRKYRNEGLVGTDDQIDAGIRMRIVTAPAIYAEALRRGMAGPLGLNALHVLGAQPVKPVKPVQPGLPDLTIPDQAGLDESILAPGVRRITLDED